MTRPLDSLVQMTRALGEPSLDCVIIGEGNTSMRLDAESFAVKASGHAMRGIDQRGFVAVRFAPMLALLDDPPRTLSEQKAITQAAVIPPDSSGGTEGGSASPPDSSGATGGLSPSIEVSFHAMLLHECDAAFVGHTHPTAINQIMCSEFAADFALRRRFPDEAVLCGPRSALVPYADPGLPLALEMRAAARAHKAELGEAPKLILLRNHGMIALGDTPSEVLNITAMAVKAARIFLGALWTGKPTPLPQADVLHVYRRPDEIYRRKLFVDSNDA